MLLGIEHGLESEIREARSVKRESSHILNYGGG